MLRQLFKNNVLTIGLSKDSLSLQGSQRHENVVKHFQNQSASLDSLDDFCKSYHAHLARQNIDLILSNSYIRFLVIPWRQHVYRREDWIAIAKYAFVEKFGPIAHDWRMNVILGEFGHDFVAYAIDISMFESLRVLQKKYHFNWRSIKPLFSLLVDRSQHTTSCVIVVEPDFILLTNIMNHEVHSFGTVIPLKNQTLRTVEQMLLRHQLNQSNDQASKKIMIYVSGYLREEWLGKQVNHRQANVILGNQVTNHAQWLTRLNVL